MGRQVFLTGGTGGLGLPVTERLLKDQWEIVTLVHSDKSSQKLKDAFPEAGEKLKMIKGDATNETDIKEALQAAGKIDALVHLAGGFKGAGSFEENSVEDFEKMILMNIRPAFLFLKYAMPLMKKQENGSIVMIGAKPALYPMGKNVAYAASKAALTNLVLSAAEEGRLHNVRANVIVPAVIDTPENRKWADNDSTTDKWTSPQAIAETIAWLISEQGKAVTGTIIPMFNKIKTF